LYTDLGLLTCDPDITSDLVNLFNYLTGLVATQSYNTLLVAPFNMRQKFNQMIDREIENARKGLPARIVAKINSMEDRDMTERLYAASNAGVKITLFVRGFCCLKPGVPGMSDNIEVVSVIGRFLEHSRVFHFASGQEDPLDGEWYISSADWMYRNLSNRVEAAVPVRGGEARRKLHRIFEIMNSDRRNAWLLRSDGGYDRRVLKDKNPAMRRGSCNIQWRSKRRWKRSAGRRDRRQAARTIKQADATEIIPKLATIEVASDGDVVLLVRETGVHTHHAGGEVASDRGAVAARSQCNGRSAENEQHTDSGELARHHVLHGTQGHCCTDLKAPGQPDRFSIRFLYGLSRR